jgi:hypothetical protein
VVHHLGSLIIEDAYVSIRQPALVSPVRRPLTTVHEHPKEVDPRRRPRFPNLQDHRSMSRNYVEWRSEDWERKWNHF